MRKSIITTSFLLIATFWAPMAVQAHAILVKSIPAKDEEVTESPKQINVWFNEGVRSEYKALAVIDSNGKRVDNHDVEQSLTDSSNLTATVPSLEPGVYTVRYRVVSKDTHIVTGKFNFTVKAP